MSIIDAATVQKVANLARINVPPEDEAQLAKDMSRILGLMEQLREVDTTGVQPMTSVAVQQLPQRADVVTDGGHAADLLANGPETTDAFFVVPKVIE